MSDVATSNAPPSLIAQGVEVRKSRKTLLHQFDLSIDRGAVALLGPNGAGKSTLLRALVGLEKVKKGALHIAGNDSTTSHGTKLLRTQIGYLAQFSDVLPGFTTREAVQYAGWLKGLRGTSLDIAVELALTRTRCEAFSELKASKLSGGEWQRLGVAQAIIHNPRFLILDEPTAALDPEERAALLDLLEEIKRDTALLFSTHNTSDLVGLVDRVVVMVGGTKRFDSTFSEFENAALATNPRGSATLDAAYRSILC